MKVIAYPSDVTAGCSYYRVFEPVEAAKRAGIDASWNIDLPVNIKRLSSGLDKVTSIKDDFDADVVVFHRPLDYRFLQAAKILRKAGVGVVVDMDDDIVAAPRGTVFSNAFNSAENNLDSVRYCQAMCRAADAVTCSTPTVERRYGSSHGFVARNGIPPHVLQMEHTGGEGIGWAGSAGNRQGDLEVVGDGVQRALEETELPFLFVGAHSQAQELVSGLGLKDWPKITGWKKPGEHYAQVAKLDIGIAPVGDSPFARARSGIKVLEYAALGIPSVASPHPEYELFNRDVLCWIADHPSDWPAAISATVSQLSVEWSANLRSIVAEKHTTDRMIGSYIDAWESAQKKAHRRVA